VVANSANGIVMAGEGMKGLDGERTLSGFKL
jgi:hypothetical protein